MFTGMRMGEINALYKSDVNLIFNSISINKTISRGVGGKPIISSSTKTEAGNRLIRITDDIKNVLSDAIRLSTDEELIFTNDKNGLLSSSTINCQFNRIIKKYDILDKSIPGKVSTHSLRHTFATRAIESGINPKALQTHLGHTDIKITFNVYSDAFEKFQSENLTKVDNYLSENGLSISAYNPSEKKGENKVKVG